MRRKRRRRLLGLARGFVSVNGQAGVAETWRQLLHLYNLITVALGRSAPDRRSAAVAGWKSDLAVQCCAAGWQVTVRRPRKWWDVTNAAATNGKNGAAKSARKLEIIAPAASSGTAAATPAAAMAGCSRARRTTSPTVTIAANWPRRCATRPGQTASPASPQSPAHPLNCDAVSEPTATGRCRRRVSAPAMGQETLWLPHNYRGTRYLYR